MYYIYEMQMPEEDLQMLKTVAAKDRISVNDLFIRCFAYIAEHPDEMRVWKEWYNSLPEEKRKELDVIKITRIYPVEDGETEEEARRRQIQKERDRILTRVPESGDWAAFQEELDPADIVWLAAKTGDCFTILRGRGYDILFHGQKTEVRYDGLLDELKKEGKLKLVARCHPGDLKAETVIE